ncbi:MAG: double-strand break repair protein AddB [Bauldia sp.]|nr:double-strand break repair protein AddB [Bauldia sp.]
MATGRKTPAVFSIPAGAPFLDTLADALLDGRLGAIPGLGEDPLAPADVTVLLPTRRAVRAFADILLARAPSGALVLPTIRPIGDVDEEEHLLVESAETAADRLLLPNAVSRVQRLLVLSRLIGAWSRAIRADLFDTAHDRRVPETAAGAVRLAADLARLIDDMEVAGIPWSELRNLIPEDYPEFRQLTLDFLKIAGEAWPAYLAEESLVNPAGRRDRLLRAEAARLVAHPPGAPIVAAGSTGSIPATAHLLATIARLPTGAVVLPGLDRELDEPSWSSIGGPEEGRGTPSHPQYGLKQLLRELGVTREAVAEIAPPDAFAARRRLLSETMRPAETTELWSSRALSDPAPALDGLSVLVARTDREEALAIAFALREAIEEPGVTAALVTPDRDLARRVSAELARWEIVADDSAGSSLDQTPPGIFARLFAEVVARPGDPAALLALLKHPMAAFGMERAECRAAARALELALMRGKALPGDLASLPDALAVPRPTELRRRDPAARLLPEDWDAAARLAGRLAAIFAPLHAAEPAPGADLAALMQRVLPAIRGAAADDTGSDAFLWQGAAGEALARLLGELAERGASVDIARADLPSFLTAVMAGARVSRPPVPGARIHIWGVLEARLQSADLMILAGLDEGVWPAETRTDPWLSRTMREQLGLEPPERRIGLAAHDFAEALAGPRVLVTRAERRAGTPTIASRWLQRLFAVIGADAAEALTARGARYLAWARHADAAAAVQPAPRPAPRPPLSLRPRGLSITEIETWIRDPYEIYAKHVLGIFELPELGAPPDAATRGIILHDILADFVTEPPPDGLTPEQHLAVLARAHFAALEKSSPDFHALWSLRWQEVARWFLDWEAGRAADIASRHAEIPGSLDFAVPGGSFTLRGRADRIDLRHDGGVEIYDYKSGQTPSPAQVATFAPQLPLEAAMVAAGAFGEAFRGRPIVELAFIGLAGIGRDDWFKPAAGKDTTPSELGAAALAKLKALVAAYDRPEQPYLSMARPMFERRWSGDYDHLARIREWRHALGDAG